MLFIICLLNSPLSDLILFVTNLVNRVDFVECFGTTYTLSIWVNPAAGGPFGYAYISEVWFFIHSLVIILSIFGSKVVNTKFLIHVLA